MARDNGGIIGVTNNPTSSTATGVWSIESQYQARVGDTWPSRALFTTKSLRFNDGSSDYLSRTPSSAGNRRTFTISTWVKRSSIESGSKTIFGIGNSSSSTSDADWFSLAFNGSTNRIRSVQYNTVIFDSNRVFRDTSAWYHIVYAVDTTQATDSNRIKIYINGVQETSFATVNYPSQNYDYVVNTTVPHMIGREDGNGSGYFDRYMAELIEVDGQQLAPTSFGVANSDGVWTPIIYTGTFGTNGFNLQFENAAALGTDSSANGNNFTVNNLTSIDQSTDYPEVNFATLNPLFTPNPSNVSTFSEGNLKVVTNSTSQNSDGLSTLGVSQGKWYGEFKLIAEATGESLCGIKTNIENPTTNGLHGTGGFSVASNGDSFNNGSSQGVGNFSASYTTNDIIGIALDLDNNRVYFSKNGSYTDGSGNFDESSPTGYFSVTSEQTYFMGVGDKSTSQSSTWEANYGSPSFAISSGNADGNGYGNFEYAPPSGYYALNTKNLGEFG